MLRSLALGLLLAAAVFAAQAVAQPVELMPGVTFEKQIELTPHGVVVIDVVTAPRPGDRNGLYALVPALAGGTVTGPLARVTQLERDLAPEATTVGLNGDAFSAADRHPSGIVIQDGALAHPPAAGRSSVGVDTAGTLHVDRVRLFGTWQGAGQRRPLNGLNQAPAAGQVVLFTPAYGPRVPAVPGSTEAVLEPFPAAAPGADLVAAVTAAGSGGGEAIPPDGAVLMATGSAAEKLAVEAAAGTQVTTRLTLQPAWPGVTAAVGGGPLLVRNGKPVFRTTEDFTNDQITSRSARAAVGQLADGRIVLVAVDGGQPGWSVGLTSYELAQALVRLGAVTASALASGPAVTLAFDGRLLDRPSGARGEQPVKDALLLQYFGVYVPAPSVPLVNGDSGRTEEELAYKLVRPSTVTAELVGPGGTVKPIETGVQHDPGTYVTPFSAFDAEGTWRWSVQATDDLGRSSSGERTFRYDTTLRSLVVPRSATGKLAVRFTLGRAAKVRLQIETSTGVAVRTYAPAALTAGVRTLVWDGLLATGTRAWGGSYVARVTAVSAIGTVELTGGFAYRR